MTTCFCGTTHFARLLDVFVRLLGNDELPLLVLPDSIVVQDMQNCNHAVMLHATLPRSCFPVYHCQKRRLVCFQAPTLSKILNKGLPAGDDVALRFRLDEDACLLSVEQSGVLLERHRLHLLLYEPCDMDVDSIPGSLYLHRFTVNLKKFCAVVARFALFHQQLAFMLLRHRTGDFVVFCAASGGATCVSNSHVVYQLRDDEHLQFPPHPVKVKKEEETVISDDDDDSQEAKDDDDIVDELGLEGAEKFVSATYNIKFLQPLNHMAPLAELATFNVRPEYVLKIDMQLRAGFGDVSYFVSPEVELNQ